MTAISYHNTIKDLQDLDWQAEGPFARLEWFRLLEQSGTAPVYAVAREGDEGVVLPLCRRGTRLEALTNWYAFTWSDLRTSGMSGDAMFEQLPRDLAGHAARIDFAKVPDENGIADRLESAFRGAGWKVLRFATDINHILRVNGRSYADYLAERPGAVRTTLKRKASKVEVSLTTLFCAEDWADYEDIYADSWKPEEGDPALLRRFAEAESAAGRFRFGIARHDGTPVAAQFWTVDGGTAYIHKLAHRISSRPFSPGTVLTAALFEHVIDTDGVALIDFGTGDDPYKADWMEEVRTRFQLTCLRPWSPRNWPTLGKAALRKLVR